GHSVCFRFPALCSLCCRAGKGGGVAVQRCRETIGRPFRNRDSRAAAGEKRTAPSKGKERSAGNPANRWHVRGAPLFYPVESGEGYERRGDADAVRCLVVFEQCGHDARQGERTAVERVGEAYLPLGVAVAELQPVGLEGLEIRYGRYLQPPFLGGRPYLEIVREGRREADVA